MSITGLPVFDTTVQETNRWLKGVEAELVNVDRQRAYEATRAVLHALRDRLTPEEAMHFAAQLPMLMRGFFTEGWHVASSPTKERSAEEFLQRVAEKLPPSYPMAVEEVTRGVFAALWTQMDHGAIHKVMEQLPIPIRRLWPSEAMAH
jgi:uncharacterized protein (DUF2267 family)